MADAAEYLEDLNRVLDVARAMGATRDLDRLLDLIVESANQLVEADRTSLFVVDEERGEIWTRVAQGTSTIRLPKGQGIAGTVAETGEIINIEDAYADARFNRDHDRSTGYRTRSILCMPLVNYDERVVGVIQALNKRSGEAFAEYDENLLGALCAQSAVALETAQLIARDRERQRMERDLELARRIQESFLPRAMPDFPGWRFAAIQRPCDQTGGDYHDFIPAHGGLDMVVGDVSGHGIPAAMMMSTARAFLLASHGDARSPGDLLGRLNRLLEQDMGDDTFMTMLVTRLSSEGGLDYASAGHDPPLIYRRGRAAFDDLHSTGMMLGVLADEEFGDCSVDALETGDIVVVLTDGIFETANDEGEEWGLERLRGVVAETASAGGGCQEVCAAIISAVDRFRGQAPITDDLSLVVGERA